jgi:hypothetical protein
MCDNEPKFVKELGNEDLSRDTSENKGEIFHSVGMMHKKKRTGYPGAGNRLNHQFPCDLYYFFPAAAMRCATLSQFTRFQNDSTNFARSFL